MPPVVAVVPSIAVVASLVTSLVAWVAVSLDASSSLPQAATDHVNASAATGARRSLVRWFT
jgi:FlaG/FlaF family flagellin (archaellin)